MTDTLAACPGKSHHQRAKLLFFWLVILYGAQKGFYARGEWIQINVTHAWSSPKILLPELKTIRQPQINSNEQGWTYLFPKVEHGHLCSKKGNITYKKSFEKSESLANKERPKKLWESGDSTMVHLRLRIVQIYIYASHGVKFFWQVQGYQISSEISFKNWVLEGLQTLLHCCYGNRWGLKNMLKKLLNNSFI